MLLDMWKNFDTRMKVAGGSINDGRRTRRLSNMQERMLRKAPGNPSFKELTDTHDGSQRYAVIIDTIHLNEKKMFAMPGETFRHGGILLWNNQRWLVTEVNTNDDFTVEYRILQCNYILKWVDETGEVVKKWCAVEDGTKYIAGEFIGKTMAIGDARLAITISKDEDTIKLHRGRRFLIDDPDTFEEVMAYKITKSNKLFNNYIDGEGVFRFVLTETNLTDDDNLDLHIADYYSWKPKSFKPKPIAKEREYLPEVVKDAIDEDDKKRDTDKGVWL